MKVKTFKVPLYLGRLIVAFTDDLNIAIKKWNLDTQSDELWACTFQDGKSVYCVFDNTMISPGIIAHEALHATNRILSGLGYIPDPNNDEAQAYLHSWIVSKIYEFGNFKLC